MNMQEKERVMKSTIETILEYPGPYAIIGGPGFGKSTLATQLIGAMPGGGMLVRSDKWAHLEWSEASKVAAGFMSGVVIGGHTNVVIEGASIVRALRKLGDGAKDWTVILLSSPAYSPQVVAHEWAGPVPELTHRQDTMTKGIHTILKDLPSGTRLLVFHALPEEGAVDLVDQRFSRAAEAARERERARREPTP